LALILFLHSRVYDGWAQVPNNSTIVLNCKGNFGGGGKTPEGEKETALKRMNDYTLRY